MLPEAAEKGLRRILELADRKDVKMIELRVVPGMRERKTRKECIDAIMSHVSQPSQVLLPKCLRKSVIEQYLREVHRESPEDQSKNDCIKACMDYWEVKNDYFLWKSRTKDETAAALRGLEKKLNRDIQLRNSVYKFERDGLKEQLNKFDKELESSFEEETKALEAKLKMEKDLLHAKWRKRIEELNCDFRNKEKVLRDRFRTEQDQLETKLLEEKQPLKTKFTNEQESLKEEFKKDIEELRCRFREESKPLKRRLGVRERDSSPDTDDESNPFSSFEVKSEAGTQADWYDD